MRCAALAATLVLGLACSKSAPKSRWQSFDMAMGPFETLAVLPLEVEGRSGAMIAGKFNVGQRVGAIYRFDGKRTRSVFYDYEHTAVVALAAHGDDIWALAQRGNSVDVVLLRSRDRGASFATVGPVPVSMAVGLAAGTTGLWAYDRVRLYHSADDGQSWEERAPCMDIGSRDRFRERDGVLEQTGSGYCRRKPDGTWQRAETAEPIVAVGPGGAAASERRGGGVFLLSTDNLAAEPLEVPLHGRVIEVARRGEVVRLLGLGDPTHFVDAWLFMQSDDGGKSWKTERLGLFPLAVNPAAALTANSGFVVHSEYGSLLVYK